MKVGKMGEGIRKKEKEYTGYGNVVPISPWRQMWERRYISIYS